MKQTTLLIFLLGATFFLKAQDLRITEIMYNPDNSDSNWEWVEVYNASEELVDLAGFVFDDNSGAAYTEANIPSGTIPAGQSAILFNASAISESDFLQVWGTVNLIPISRWSALNNTGDTIGIWSSFDSYSGDNSTQENVIEQVIYNNDEDDWPNDDGAASIFLTDINADATIGAIWSLSAADKETPFFTTYTSKVFGIHDGSDVGSPGTPVSIDTEKPIIMCPEDVDMTSAEDICGANFPLILPTAFDNVSTELLLQGTRDDGLDLGENFPVGVTSVAWTATDEAGNVSEECIQIIIITANVEPVINCAEDIQTVSHDGSPVSLEIELATASNACNGELTLDWVRSDEEELLDPFPVGTTSIVWTAIDASDNLAVCTQTVTVNFEVSENNSILFFSLLDLCNSVEIDNENKTINVLVEFGADLSNLVPIIELSEGASIFPESETPQDFTNSINYTVTTADGSEEVWAVTIENEEENAENMHDLSISSFILVNADTNENLFVLEDGVIIDLNDLPTLNLNIQAITSDNTESVRLSLEGSQNTSRTENVPPYALFGDSPSGNYLGNDFVKGTYKLTATPNSEDNLAGNNGESVSLNFELVEEPLISVNEFVLVNSETNEDLFLLEEGMQIDLDALPQTLNIRANTSNSVESVHLSLTGNKNEERTENLAPYALFGDFPSGNYNGDIFSAGSYTLKASPYSEDNLKGELGEEVTVNFEIIETNSLSITEFILVNADTNEDIFLITEGMQIDMNTLPTLNLNIRIDSSADVESVLLSLTGTQGHSRTENTAPYALFGDFPAGNYTGNIFELGEYKVSAKAFSENNLEGEMGDSFFINFRLIELLITANQNDSMSVYTNHETSKAVVQFKTPKSLSVIYLYDVLGRVVGIYKGKEVLRGEDYLLNTSSIREGNYFINTRDENGVLYQKQVLIRK